MEAKQESEDTAPPPAEQPKEENKPTSVPEEKKPAEGKRITEAQMASAIEK